MGACSPGRVLDRCSEIASEVILGQKRSRSSYMARGILHPILAVHACTHLLSQADFEGTKVGRTAGGVTSLEGQLSSA